jgi:hypothetical protein
MHIPKLPVVVIVALFASLLASLGACTPTAPQPDAGVPDGGVVVDAGPDTPATLSTHELCAGLEERVCQGMTTCACSLDAQPYTLTTCTSVRTQLCEQAINDQLGGPLAAGALIIPADNANACFVGAEANAASCRALAQDALPEPCVLLFVDVATTGEPCTGGITGGACDGGASLCVPGSNICTARPHAGDDCGVSDFCGPSLICDASHQCAQPPALGIAGAACTSSSACAAGLVCSPEQLCVAGPASGTLCSGGTCSNGEACARAFDTRTCTDQGAAGAVCTVDVDCASPLVCDANGTCAPAPAQDEPCAPSGVCGTGLTCDSGNTNTCVHAPGIGEPCIVGPATCADGLGCDVNNLCAAPPGDGEPCLLPQLLCADGLGCAFEANGSICRTQVGPGGACTNDRSCSNSFCDFSTNTCTALLLVGESCPNGNGCAAGLECSDLAGGNTCQPIPPHSGDVCFQACGAGLVCHGEGGRCAPDICTSRIP